MSIPVLRHSNGYIDIRANTALNVNFTSLISIDGIELTGNITSAAFPVLKQASSINIDSNRMLDCGPAEKAFNRIEQNNGVDDTYDWLISDYSCTSKLTEPEHPSDTPDTPDTPEIESTESESLSGPVISGIIVASLSGTCILVLAFFCFKKVNVLLRRKMQANGASYELQEHQEHQEAQSIDVADEPLPKYEQEDYVAPPEYDSDAMAGRVNTAASSSRDCNGALAGAAREA
ncbi:hypothetical protein PHISP_02069 [Aspergillus sp. HF37]|nr:hypothetical protein PHISP_02069 [Aspergillus sp. HF37]